MDLGAYQTKQAEQAKNFRAKMPSMQQEQEVGIKQNTRSELARELAGIRGNMSSRGLLYSGLRRGAEADQSAQAASQAAAQRANVNQTLLGQAEGLDQNAIQSGLALQQSRQAQADAEYEARNKGFQARQGMFKELGGAIGITGGAALGGV